MVTPYENLHVPSEFATLAAAVVDHLDEHVPLGVWMVSRHVDDEQVYVHVRDRSYGVGPGDSHPWEDSLCRRMLAGEGPLVAPDAQAVPAYAEAGANEFAAIGTYVGVPIGLDEYGDAYGTLCGLAPEASDPSLQDHEPLLRLLGDALGAVLRAESGADQHTRRALDGLAPMHRDRLTGTANARGLTASLRAAAHRCREFGDTVTVVVARPSTPVPPEDGHELVRRAAALLVDATRPDDLVARTTDDGFTLLLTGLGAADAAAVVRRLDTTLRRGGVPMRLGHGPMSIRHGLDDVVARAEASLAAA